MKVISLILSFLIVSLAGLPCADAHLSSVNQEEALTMADHGNEHHPEESSDEHHCSPFCICHCCHTHVVISVYSIQLKHSESFVSTFIPEREHIYLNQRIQAIWRPPQLS